MEKTLKIKIAALFFIPIFCTLVLLALGIGPVSYLMLPFSSWAFALLTKAKRDQQKTAAGLP